MIPESIARSLSDELTQDEAVQWARDNLRVRLSDATTMDLRTEDGQEGKDFTGSGNGIIYTFRFLDNRLQNVLLYWESSAPTADTFMECFGAPDFYRALYQEGEDDKWIYLELWYLDAGRLASGRYILRDPQATLLDGTAVLDAASVVPPGTAEENIEALGAGAQVTDEDRARLDSLKPWPGSWEDVEVDDVPSH